MEFFEFSVKDSTVTPSRFAKGTWHLVVRDVETLKELHCMLKHRHNIKRLDVYFKEGLKEYDHGPLFERFERFEDVLEVNAVLPKSFERLDVFLFKDFANLKNVVIQNKSMEFIKNPFSENHNLECIEFPENQDRIRIENNMLIVEDVLIHFFGKEELAVIPETVRSIGDAAFANAKKLRCIKIPDFVQSIGEDAFINSGIENVELPECITEIPVGLFQDCKSLKSFTIPNSVTSIGLDAFCRSGLICVEIPKTVKRIEDGAFSGCLSLESVKLPEGLEKISHSLFSSCFNLKYINIPDSVLKICADAFYHCFNVRHSRITSDMVDGRSLC